MPTVDTEIAVRFQIYVLENNAYTFVRDIENVKPLRVYVYENNDRIVAQAEFYYERALKFSAFAGKKYIFRFYNDGVLKLVSFTYPSLVEESHVNKLYKKDQGIYHL